MTTVPTPPFRAIPEMLARNLALRPDAEAFRQFHYETNRWERFSWRDYAERVTDWRRAFAALGLQKGERVAMLLTSSIEAVTFDQAALANGLVPVPLHAIDTPGACAYILRDAQARCLVTSARARWNAIAQAAGDLPALDCVVFVNDEDDAGAGRIRRLSLQTWLAEGRRAEPPEPELGADDLAGLIYTSGTTGRPKGVMVTHGTILANVEQIASVFDFREDDVFLSYLPLSHTFERCVAHYTALRHGAALAFARSVANLEHDLLEVQPTLMCSVPRVYERIYQKLQAESLHAGERERYLTDWFLETGWRRFCAANGLPVEKTPRMCLDNEIWAKLDDEIGEKIRRVFGSRLRATFSGGASLNRIVSRFFCAAGISVQQVYGLTETMPIVTWTRTGDNRPECVGRAVPGTELRIGANDELQVRGPQVMPGYWGKPAESAAAFTPDGWFRTGDQADIDADGHVRIKGRIKEIVVTSTGEKIAPVDVEFAIQADPLFEQVMIVGENRPFVAALAVVNDYHWHALCRELGLDPEEAATLESRDVKRAVLKRIRAQLGTLPQYGVPRAVGLLRTPWTVDNELLTSTLKLKRAAIAQRFSELIDALYFEAPR